MFRFFLCIILVTSLWEKKYLKHESSEESVSFSNNTHKCTYAVGLLHGQMVTTIVKRTSLTVRLVVVDKSYPSRVYHRGAREGFIQIENNYPRCYKISQRILNVSEFKGNNEFQRNFRHSYYQTWHFICIFEFLKSMAHNSSYNPFGTD